MAQLGQPLTLGSVIGTSGAGYTNNIASMMKSGDINIRVNSTKTIKTIKPSKITVGKTIFTNNSVTGPKLLTAIKEHNSTDDVYFTVSGVNHNLFGVNGIVKGTLKVDDKTMTLKEKKESKGKKKEEKGERGEGGERG